VGIRFFYYCLIVLHFSCFEETLQYIRITCLHPYPCYSFWP